MFRKLVLALVVLAFTVTAALAAPVAAKVSAVEGEKITVTLQADKPAWMKVGAPVKLKSIGPGKVTAIDGTTVTIASKKAGSVKIDQEVAIDKGGMAGC
jgi:hypothetical protein